MIDINRLYGAQGVLGVIQTGASHVAIGIDPYVIQQADSTLNFCDGIHERGFEIVTFLQTAFGHVAIVRPLK